MPSFRWEAVDADGRRSRGHDDAPSARALRDRLRAKGLTPTAVDEAPASRSLGVALGERDLALVTRQVATLAQAGVRAEARAEAAGLRP